jgi:3-methyl-2-oxobutanoate hydroxymethyltransferase
MAPPFWTLSSSGWRLCCLPPERCYHLGEETRVRRTIDQIREFKRRGERFAMLTAYDYSLARLLDAAGIPILLVGDSLGMVVLGHQTTLPVTIEDMLRHTQAVVRGTEQALIVADMPFLSYQASVEEALRNAGRLLKEGGAQAVKLEGGAPMAETVRRMVESGIPVMGHIGLTPQSVNQLSGYRVQGRTAAAASRLLTDAQALEAAGAFSIVLETIPAPLARRITAALAIPTVGIGAGPDCDGQVQVLHDILGLFPDFTPRHARRYAELGQAVSEAVGRYAADVAAGTFPGERESFAMDEALLADLGRDGAAPTLAPRLEG